MAREEASGGEARLVHAYSKCSPKSTTQNFLAPALPRADDKQVLALALSLSLLLSFAARRARMFVAGSFQSHIIIISISIAQ